MQIKLSSSIWTKNLIDIFNCKENKNILWQMAWKCRKAGDIASNFTCELIAILEALRMYISLGKWPPKLVGSSSSVIPELP